MANIVISRIQHRRGRRENLPQPLLPAEIALTSDTNQAWMGQDPTLAVASVNVYSDQLETTAQGIIDAQIVESRFDQSFNASIFATMVNELKSNTTVTLTDADILWDNTFRGEILTVTGSGGSGYTGGGLGVGDSVVAISATGTGFVGWVDTIGGGGSISTIVVTSGGSNYQFANTTFTVAGGSSGTLSLVSTDVLATIVHIAADVNTDPDNTAANIIDVMDGVINTPAITALITDRHISSAIYSGTFTSNSMLVNNHIEAANIASLINRVNSTTPGQITGLTYTNLNIEMTGGTNAGAVILPYEAGYYFEGLILAANALKALHVTTQAVTFASGVASEAYANVPSLAAVVQIYDLQKNGVSFGDVTFTGTSGVGVVTIGASTSFIKGDRLEVFGPASPDGVLDQISITLTGTITV